MVAFYDSKPSVLEGAGGGTFLYRWNITETEAPSMPDREETRTQWRCEEIRVASPVTSNRITEAVITEKWDANYEQKLVNEYNSAILGLYSDEEKERKVKAYTDYLSERAEIKRRIDEDCEELGIK